MPQIRKEIRARLEGKIEAMVIETVKQRETIDERYRKLAFKVPGSLPADVSVAVGWNGISLGMPANMQLMEDVRQRFITSGWVVEPFTVDEYGLLETKGWIPDPERPDTKWARLNQVSMAAYDYKDGSNCKVVEIGSTLVPRKVYERRCEEDGAGVLDAADSN